MVPQGSCETLLESHGTESGTNHSTVLLAIVGLFGSVAFDFE